MRAIASGDRALSSRLLREQPALASTQLVKGAGRREAESYYFPEIGHYAYAGATALHIAAGAYREDLVRKLLSRGADVRARDRRGAEPLHKASVGQPGSHAWNPIRQIATIRCLLEAGADSNAAASGEVTPLHRAVRTRCADAVRALLIGGANPGLRTKRGSTLIALATQNTGREGSGSPEAKEQQREILALLREHQT